jgi:hypothetical protein
MGALEPILPILLMDTIESVDLKDLVSHLAQTVQVSRLSKPFSLSLTMRPNEPEGLSLETLSSQVLEFEGKARANPIGASFRCFLLG